MIWLHLQASGGASGWQGEASWLRDFSDCDMLAPGDNRELGGVG